MKKRPTKGTWKHKKGAIETSTWCGHNTRVNLVILSLHELRRVDLVILCIYEVYKRNSPARMKKRKKDPHKRPAIRKKRRTMKNRPTIGKKKFT